MSWRLSNGATTSQPWGSNPSSESSRWFELSAPSRAEEGYGGLPAAFTAAAGTSEHHKPRATKKSGSGSESGEDGAHSSDAWSEHSSHSSQPLSPDSGTESLLSGRRALLPSLRRSRRGNRSHRRRPTGATFGFLAPRRVQLLLALAIPVLGILIILELHDQAAKTALWAAEAIRLNAHPTPDGNGRLDLERWRKDKGTQWPEWWGNVDEVGRSPWDHMPPSVHPWEMRRVLFLTAYDDYLERMNTHTYEIVDAALRHPQVIVDVWGPGWAGYDWSVPLSTNIKRRANRVAELEAKDPKAVSQRQEAARERWAQEHRQRDRWSRLFAAFGVEPDASEGTDLLDDGKPKELPPWDTFNDTCNSDVQYDIAWTISDIYKKKDMPHVDALDCGTLLVQQLGDCHDHRCMKEWYPQANNITVTKYAFELEELFGWDNVRKHYPDFHMGLFGHSPDTGNEWDFYPLPWSEKTAKASVFGFDSDFYPIRTTVTRHLNWLRDNPQLGTSIISRHRHPGYTVHIPEEARKHPLETYELGHKTYETHRAIRADFAHGMRTAQICVFDSSLERKFIRKYAQAFLSGCVVATDLPTEHEEALAGFTIPLRPTWNIEQIEAQMERYLAQPEKLHQMALDAFAYARKHLTTTSKITDMLALVDEHRAGQRGYAHTHSFSSRCRSYWGRGQRPPWCKKEDGYRGLEDREDLHL